MLKPSRSICAALAIGFAAGIAVEMWAGWPRYELHIDPITGGERDEHVNFAADSGSDGTWSTPAVSAETAPCDVSISPLTIILGSGDQLHPLYIGRMDYKMNLDGTAGRGVEGRVLVIGTMPLDEEPPSRAMTAAAAGGFVASAATGIRCAGTRI